MPVWNPPANGYANAFTGVTLPPAVKVETKGASAYEQEQMGQRSETSQVIPINRGEIETTSKGDYLQQTRSVITATESYEESVTVTDIGAGATSLVPLTSMGDGESNDVVTEVSSGSAQQQYEQGQLETSPSYNTNDQLSPFYQPENAPPPVYFEPLPVEQAPVDEPQYVQGQWTGLGAAIARWNEWQEILGFTVEE